MKSKKIGLLAIAISLITFMSGLILSILFSKYLINFLFTLIIRKEILVSFVNLSGIVTNVFLLGLILVLIAVHWKILSSIYANVSNEAKILGLKVNSHHTLLLGILLSLSLMLSSPVFFTKDKIYSFGLNGFKSVSVKDLKLNILAKNVIFISSTRRGQDVYCDLKYEISFDDDINPVIFGEEYIYPVMAFIDTNEVDYIASYQNTNCNTAQDAEKAKSLLRIRE